MKRALSILVLLLAMGAMFVGCSKDGATEIYYLQFKPEVAEIYQMYLADYFQFLSYRIEKYEAEEKEDAYQDMIRKAKS